MSKPLTTKSPLFKSLAMAVWTLIVGFSCFTAGRLAAPMEEAITVPTLSAAPTNSSVDQVNPAQASVATMVSDQVLSQQRPATHMGGGSYAADYQGLQTLVVLAATNPQLAMEQAQRFKGAVKTRAEAAILEVWGGVDPYGAWNWVTSFQPENGQQYLHLLEVIGRSQPQTAISYAEKYLASHYETRKDIYQATLAGITQAGDYRLATQWLESLALEPEVKAELTGLVVTNWATYEPRAAAQWLASQPAEVGAATVKQLGDSWVDADPQGAVAFAAGTTGQAGNDLLLSSFKKWLSSDPGAATSWLSAQREKVMDPLLGEVATMPQLVDEHVQNALSWAAKIQAPELRINTLTSILSALKQKDPHLAASYLQQVDYLSEAERSRLYEDLAFEHQQ